MALETKYTVNSRNLDGQVITYTPSTHADALALVHRETGLGAVVSLVKTDRTLADVLAPVLAPVLPVLPGKK